MITISNNTHQTVRAEFAEILNSNGQPVQCTIILSDEDGAPVIEIVQPFQEDGRGNLVSQNIRIEVKSKEITELQNQFAAEIKEIESDKSHIAYITATPAKLDYSDLVNIAMIQADGEINGWDKVSASDLALYATRKARAEANAQYLAILNSCRSNFRADKEADAMRARAERLMDEMAVAGSLDDMIAIMSLDEQIALGLYDEELRTDADIAEWERRVARDEIEADEMAARQEEERGSAF